MTDRMAPGTAPAKPSPWNDPKVRAIVYQVALIGGILLLGAYLVHNTLVNLEERQIRSGYGFLGQEAGFFMGESIIPFDAADSYGRAFLAGLLNTLKVAFVGIILATVLGTVVGIARLSRNWLLARLATSYVELLRNLPLLLQLFFWYATLTTLLPDALETEPFFAGTYLSKSGLAVPMPVADPVHDVMWLALLAGAFGAFVFARWARKRQEATGAIVPTFLPSLGLIIGLPLLVWLAGGAPTEMDVPEKGKFAIVGGGVITSEFMALLFGLVTYTASFIAEIVRAGILAVNWGQTEAASALGLPRSRVLRLVVLPQALRVIVPPLTSQYLNITKNSSLAVAIGYPDLVSVANTTLNQTGQAIECISVIMAVYLTISLGIAAYMNWYNKRIALVER